MIIIFFEIIKFQLCGNPRINRLNEIKSSSLCEQRHEKLCVSHSRLNGLRRKLQIRCACLSSRLLTHRTGFPILLSVHWAHLFYLRFKGWLRFNLFNCFAFIVTFICNCKKAASQWFFKWKRVYILYWNQLNFVTW